MMQAPPPDQIRSLPIWVTWKRENGTKVPYNARTGKKAKSNDPSTWSTYAEARAAAAAADDIAGIGNMFPDDGNLTGVDFDDCFTEDGDLIPEVATAIARLNSYSEVSPSGAGVKVWVEGSIPENIGVTAFHSGSKAEIYSRRRFFAFTGNHLTGTPLDIRPAQEALNLLAEQVRPTPAPARARPTIPASSLDADHVRRYCLAALAGECAKMEAAGDGQRHWQRWCSAKALAGFVHTHGITEQEIFDGLDINHGTNPKVARQTIRDAIAAGLDAPRDIPVPEQPEFNTDGHACCPSHNERLIACKNGNGYRCPAPKMGEPLCFWWLGEGYTPPAELSADDLADLDSLDPAELRQRLLVAIAERDRWKERAQAAEAALDQTKERNRFVTQATGANIAAAGKRITLIELKKEIDTAPGDGRQDGEWNRVRPSYMGKCTNQNKSTISNHLAEYEREGWIERDVRRIRDPETGKWTAATFVRTLVDLSDPSQVNLPAKPRGLHACAKCGSMKLKRRSILRCTCCGHEQSTPEEWANPKEVRDIEDEIVAAQAATEAELQTTTQDSEPADDAATFFEQMSEPVAAPLSCNIPNNKKDNSPSLSELQTTTHSTRPHSPPPIDSTDPYALPGVRSGLLAADDPWIRHQQALAAKAVTP